MADSNTHKRDAGNPYKVVDHIRQNKKGIIARSLKDLISTARIRFSVPTDAKLTIVLEQDGTEIDDEEYFATIEQNTNLMILYGTQKWIGPENKKSPTHFIVVDDIDHNSSNLNINLKEHIPCHNQIQVGSLVTTLQNEPSQISFLSGTDLEMLSDMDPDSVADMISDRLFIEHLKQASGRFLAEKRQAQESMSLLQLFSSKTEMEQT